MRSLFLHAVSPSGFVYAICALRPQNAIHKCVAKESVSTQFGSSIVVIVYRFVVFKIIKANIANVFFSLFDLRVEEGKSCILEADEAKG